jgi:hypothetical protein
MGDKSDSVGMSLSQLYFFTLSTPLSKKSTFVLMQG